MFTGGSDSVICVWSLESFVKETTFNKHTGVITALEICGTKLFSGSNDSNVYVWNVASLKFETKLKDTELAAADGDTSSAQQLTNRTHVDKITDITSHEARVYTASWDCYIKVWDARKLTKIFKVFVNPLGICWSLEIRQLKGMPAYLVCGVRDGDVEIRSLKKLNRVSSMEEACWCSKLDHHSGWVTAILPLPDGRIVTASQDWTVKIWGIRGVSVPTPPAAIRQLTHEQQARLSPAQREAYIRQQRERLAMQQRYANGHRGGRR